MLELFLSTNTVPSTTYPLGAPTFNVLGTQAASAIDDAGENIYFTGGILIVGGQSKGLTKYNIATNTWTKLASSTIANTARGVMVFLNNKLYYINRDEIAIYDITTNTWSYKPGVPYGQIYNQYGGSAFVRNGLIYIVSRDSAATVPGCILSWNPATSVWATVYTAPTGDAIWLYNRSTVVNEVIYISSGYLVDKVARYSFATGRLPDLILPKPLGTLGVTAGSGDWVYFGGGNHVVANPNLQKAFFRYNVITSKFEDLPLPGIPGADNCAAIVSKGVMYLYAGQIWGSSTPTDKLWRYQLPKQ